MSDKTQATAGCASLVLLALIFLVCGGAKLTDGPHYSEGHRDGKVQKFSRKGFVRKTWEGELALEGFQRKGESLGNVFAFSVEDDRGDVAEQIENLTADEEVRLHYRQRLWGSWWHDTSYRVVRVERLKEGK